jgi:hypothetical protein
MSKQMGETVRLGVSENIEEKDSTGFMSALYIQMGYGNQKDPQLKEIKDELSNMKITNDNLSTPSKTPKLGDLSKINDLHYKNCISSDLLKRLEESSPIKSQKSVDFKRRFSADLCLLHCDKNGEDDSYNKSEGNLSKEECVQCEEDNPEVLFQKLHNPKNSKNNIINLINNAPNNMNNILNNKREKIAEQQEKILLDEQQINFSNFHLTKNFMPKAQVLKKNDEEEESNQYNRDRYSSLFSNQMNFNEGGQHEQSQNSFCSPVYNTKQFKKNDSSPLCSYYDGTTEYLSQSYYKEYSNRNSEINLNNSNNPMMNKKVMNTHNFIKKRDPQENQFENYNDYMQANYSNMYEDPYTQMMLQQNSAMGNNLNSKMMQNKLQQQNYYSNNNEMNQQVLYANMNKMKKMQVINNIVTNNMNSFNENPEEYLTEMFGKKGWICEMCNNFNYESKNINNILSLKI